MLNLYLYILAKFQKEYNTRINAIKDETTDGENDFGPFFKAVELFKEIFEEKIPILTYSRLKQQVDKMLVSKATMKIIDIDKFLNFVLTCYMRHYINFNSPSEIIYNAWTLHERNFMTMNEVYITTELIKPVSITVDIPEEGKQTKISKDQFYSLFTDHMKGRPGEEIYSHQYKEVMNKVDTFGAKRIKKLFDLTPYKNSVTEFKQEFQDISEIIKDRLAYLFKGKKWKQLNRLDDKSIWLLRLHAVQKSIGVVNTTLLKISLTLVKESIDFFILQKRELLAGREDEDDEDDEGESNDSEDDQKEEQSAERANNEIKTSVISPNKQRIHKKTTKRGITHNKKISQDESNIPSSPKRKSSNKSENFANKNRFKPTARKSMSTQKSFFTGNQN